MLVQQPFPPDWRLVLVTPDKLVGLSADREVQAFAKMISIPREVTAEMCRLTLLGLLPALLVRPWCGGGGGSERVRAATAKIRRKNTTWAPQAPEKR